MKQLAKSKSEKLVALAKDVLTAACVAVSALITSAAEHLIAQMNGRKCRVRNFAVRIYSNIDLRIAPLTQIKGDNLSCLRFDAKSNHCRLERR